MLINESVKSTAITIVNRIENAQCLSLKVCAHLYTLSKLNEISTCVFFSFPSFFRHKFEHFSSLFSSILYRFWLPSVCCSIFFFLFYIFKTFLSTNSVELGFAVLFKYFSPAEPIHVCV